MKDAVTEWFQSPESKPIIKKVLYGSSVGRYTKIKKAIEVPMTVKNYGSLGHGLKLDVNTMQLVEIQDPLTKIQVVLKADAQGGYIVLTSFPVK